MPVSLRDDHRMTPPTDLVGREVRFGSVRLAGVDPKTVRRYVANRDAGRPV